MTRGLHKLTFEYDGQIFTRVAMQPYTNKFGRAYKLTVWETACAECGRRFTFSQRGVPAYPTRRCEKHRKPGVKFRAKRKRKSRKSGLSIFD